ncbi:MAG: hypothetical protein AAGD43_18360 [Pseudomonadota bacterium]
MVDQIIQLYWGATLLILMAATFPANQPLWIDKQPVRSGAPRPLVDAHGAVPGPTILRLLKKQFQT